MATSLQINGLRPREGWTAVTFPPPQTIREPDVRSLTGPFFFLFQRGLAEPPDFWRLAFDRKMVFERPASLAIRPSLKSRRIQKATYFQILSGTGLRQICGRFDGCQDKWRHPRAAWFRAVVRVVDESEVRRRFPQRSQSLRVFTKGL